MSIRSIANQAAIRAKNIGTTAIYSAAESITLYLSYTAKYSTQKADVSITWNDICEFTETVLEVYEHEDAFVLKQFVAFLKENGMGTTESIRPEALLGYWPAFELENHLNSIFSHLGNENWEVLCPGLKTFSGAVFNPTFNKIRWGAIRH